jgi:hypothetical protein
MQARRSSLSPVLFHLSLSSSAALFACGGHDPIASPRDPVTTPDSGDAPEADGGTETAPLYAMMVQVYDQDDRTVYVSLSKTLDIGETVDLGKAREFPGVANFAPVGGRLLISSGIEPKITAFDISEDLKWTEGDSISFANYPFEDNANFYYQYILDDHTAYMPWDVTKRLIWDPTEMTITEMLDDSSIPLMHGTLQAEVGGNRNAIRYDGAVQQAFYYTNDDYTEDGPESIIAIYDEKTHKEKKLITVACPALAMPSQDEDGYTYYGTWGFSVKAVFGEGPKPCIARLKPDLTLDEDWTTDLRDLTDGRYHNNFRYVGNGKAIANVFYPELLAGVDWAGPYDPDVDEKVAKSGPHWKLWMFDLKKKQGKPVEGIDVDVSSGAQFAVLDGRTFVFAPYEDWGRTKIYELDKNGKASVHSDTVGDVFKWIKVR